MHNPVTIGGRSFDLPLDNNGYWAARMHHDLYRLTVAIARGMFPEARSAIDVGSNTSGLICELDWIERRVASDIQARLVPHWAHVPGVEFVPGNAFEIAFGAPFDLVISNQTVEHLDDAAGFVAKLLDLGTGLILSTTYEVPAGTIPGHVQDPIDHAKFRSWFPCELDAWLVCHHPTNRVLKHIVGVVKQSHPANPARTDPTRRR
jgi:hypothetical protein